MANDTDDVRDEPAPVFMAWGMAVEARDGLLDDGTLWLAGGAALLLWTALALLLTA